MDLLGGGGGGAGWARWGAGRLCYFHDKAEKYNEWHSKIHVIVMTYTVSEYCSIFSLLLIVTKANTTQVLDEYPPTRAGRAPPYQIMLDASLVLTIHIWLSSFPGYHIY